MLESLRYVPLKYAVQRAMFCPDCGTVLDVKRAVLVNDKGIACAKCYDKVAHMIDEKHNDVLDGRQADWEIVDMMEAM